MPVNICVMMTVEMFGILGKLLDSNEKQLKNYYPLVVKINTLEPEIKALSDEALRAKTTDFRTGLTEGRYTLDSILPEVFAVCREGIRRTLGERAFDVQLLAGIVLHQGKIAEQKTGEGKTHAATFALYLNALTGLGVHMVTVNDYLARRDTGWYGQALSFLGLKIGCIIQQEKSYILDQSYTDPSQIDPRLAHLRPVERREAYAADVTYGTNNEFGFDYLRDNSTVFDPSQTVQRGYRFAIVDEVDFALIDEARTPLIISGPGEEATDKYFDFAKLVEKLTPKTDFVVDEKMHTANLTEIGVAKIEKWLGVDNLYEKDFQTLHLIEQSLKAKTLFFRDRDYMVSTGQIVIVDEFTGRPMFGKRYSEGLHQAIEAKEGLSVQQESKTYAMTSFQNYFRLYDKLAGMTGTAVTEAEEFYSIYKLDVVVIPTNRSVVRADFPDMIFKSESAKWQAVVMDIIEKHEKGRPVLVGTTSIERNELLSKFLDHKGVKYQMLNAKNHEKEATVLAEAGQRGGVTIATNMAGRGVDIKLGAGVADLGGLHVIGTERHEARRIDNQLRGRGGRQGDPGSSRFYLSLQDDLLRLFGGDQVRGLMDRFGFEENVPIEHPLVSRSIEQAQKKMEGNNFDARKRVVEYDDVLNKQRETIYTLRRRILELPYPEAKVTAEPLGLEAEPVSTSVAEWFLGKLRPYPGEIENVWRTYETSMGKDWYQVVRQAALSTLDTLWMEHLTTIEDLREGIGLRGYAGHDPLVIYKKEAHTLFTTLLETIYGAVAERLLKLHLEAKERDLQEKMLVSPKRELNFVHRQPESVVTAVGNTGGQPSGITFRRDIPKVGRNDLCSCGSGKKYKKCHGQ